MARRAQKCRSCSAAYSSDETLRMPTLETEFNMMVRSPLTGGQTESLDGFAWSSTGMDKKMNA